MSYSQRNNVLITAIALIVVNLLIELHQTEAVMFTVLSDSDRYSTYSKQSLKLCLTSNSKDPIRGPTSRKSLDSSGICTCPRIYCPVCGTDDISYGNLCIYRCAKSSHSGLKIAKNGRCS